MKYKFFEEVFENREELDEAIRNYAEENYDNFLDECYESVNICGYEYSPSHVLPVWDPIAYRCGIDDYENFLRSEVEEIDEECE